MVIGRANGDAHWNFVFYIGNGVWDAVESDSIVIPFVTLEMVGN